MQAGDGQNSNTIRIDTGSLSKAEVLDNGWLRAPAHLSRVGVFEYRMSDGTTRRELRAPDEVFSKAALESFAMVPLTDDHPAAGRLDAENTADAPVVGHVGDEVSRSGYFVSGRVMVTNAKAVKRIVDGEKVQLSCGYTCDVEEKPGMWNGIRYDAIQTNIRGNHVALVEKGRAGPDVRVRLDSTSAVMVADGEAMLLKTIKLDGVDFEIPENAAQAFEKELSKRDAEIADAKKAADETAARADSAEAELAKAREEIAAAPEKIKASLKARIELEHVAAGVLGPELKIDGLSDREIQLAVIEKAAPGPTLAEKSDDYVRARFDMAVELAKKTDPMAGVSAALATRNDGANSLDEVHAKFREASKNASKLRGN